MIEERLIKTHLIVTDIHEEYSIKWHGSIVNTKPLLTNGLPTFIIKSSRSRLELNTIDIDQIERCAKLITNPHGRAAVTTDKAYIYIKEVGDHDKLIGTVTHNHIKKYAPMYDKIPYR